MSFLDYILVGGIGLCCIWALRSIRRQQKRGGGCCGCCSACNHQCASSDSLKERNPIL